MGKGGEEFQESEVIDKMGLMGADFMNELFCCRVTCRCHTYTVWFVSQMTCASKASVHFSFAHLTEAKTAPCTRDVFFYLVESLRVSGLDM